MDPTPFAELNQVLASLVDAQRRILAGDLVGSYLVGSFAVGDADIYSDCDFLCVVRRAPPPRREEQLRALHAEIPTRQGHWPKHLEGSYAVAEDLRTLEGLGARWLYVDHGAREMEWSTHCNTLTHRWSLRERGVVLHGPAPATLVAPVDPEAIKTQNREDLETLLRDLATWIDIERIAWGQRYAVTTVCRHLYSIATGAIASKPAAMRWAADRVDARWRALIKDAATGRARGFDTEDVPAATDVAETIAFWRWACDAVWTIAG